MAVLTGPTLLASGGGSGQTRWVLLSFQKVSANDTYDVATVSGIPAFVTVTSALFVATSNRTATTTLATISGTVVTAIGAGITNDACILFALGE